MTDGAEPPPPSDSAGAPEGETAAIIVAAGSGTRFGGPVPKQYSPLAGRPLVAHALTRFAAHPAIGRIVAVIDPSHTDMFARAARGIAIDAVVHGGDDRQASVHRALEHLSTEPPKRVLIQDGVRPLASAALISRVVAALADAPAAIPTLPVSDTLVRGTEGVSGGTVAREGLHRVQTPQGFRFEAILEAHRAFAGDSHTDDAGLARKAGHAVRLVQGEETNMKITRPEDAETAEALLGARLEPRTGQGFDVHRLGPASPGIAALRLGGIDIPFDRAMIGFSDADVALHAVTDAILGALGQGDIGQHFPPGDARWQGADSAFFLERTREMAAERGARIAHIDLTVICQQPKIGPHRAEMARRIADILAIEQARVNVKATTTEGLGFTGRGEGIAAMASASLLVPPPCA